MVATLSPTYASERVADICAGNVTSARTNVRSGGIIVLDFVGVVKVFCEEEAVHPRVLGRRCLKQDLQDYWGFSGLQATG